MLGAEGVTTGRFIPLPTSLLTPCANSCLQVEQTNIPHHVLRLIAVGRQYIDPRYFDVFHWPNPLKNIPPLPYPPKLRSFRQPSDVTGEEKITAYRLISDRGPFIGLAQSEQSDNYLTELAALERTVIEHEVPEHQARGFHVKAVGYWRLAPQINRITTTVCTKGNGVTGYWLDRRQKEMLEAIERRDNLYPLNPDPFHARDHSGQSVGQKKGDEVVWVGGASATVIEREVNGFQIYSDCGIFSPICLPPKVFERLPLGTGQLINTGDFVNQFAEQEKLVYLAKAWGCETRIWRNHIHDRYMTAAHILSAKEDGAWIFERILDNLSHTVKQRKTQLRKDELSTRALLSSIPKDRWQELIGHAGVLLQKTALLEMGTSLIPQILALNMIENTARAAANRLYGKPVAWHLENIGRWGEVSGGERIYGMGAKGLPSSIERNFFFACLFDGYMATAIEWAATNNSKYVSFEEHFRHIRNRTLQLNQDHWLRNITCINDLVAFCKQEKPEYKVNFRSEDAFPLVVVPGSTAENCISTEDGENWKDWNMVTANMYKFLDAVFHLYHS